MQDFIETVEKEALRDQLWDAIQGRGAFHRFRDILSRYPKVQQQWFEFEGECARKRIGDWLADLGITPVTDDDAPVVGDSL